MKNILIRVKYFLKVLIRKIYFCFQNKNIVLDNNNQNVYIFLAADYGNIGDIAITYAQSLYLKEILPLCNIIEIPLYKTEKYLSSVKLKIKPDDIITIIGGGNLTNRYDSIEEARRMVIKNLKNNKIISFPQTIEFTEDIEGRESKRRSEKIYSKNRNLIIFAREKKSYEKMKEIFKNNKVKLSPDIVMYLKGKLGKYENKREKIGVCLRDDKEKLIGNNIKYKIIEEIGEENIEYLSTYIEDSEFQYDKREEVFFDLLNKISEKKVFITDRLHGMIFCYLTDTPCLVFDNDNHKIKETYDLWLKECNYIKMITEEDVENINEYVEKVEQLKKKDVNLQYKFNDLKNAIMEE